MEDKRPNTEKNDDKSLPGYPHHPPQEDIMSPASGEKQVDMNVDNLTRSTHIAGKPEKPASADSNINKNDGLEMDDDSNVTEEEKNLLEATSTSTFSQDEENLSRSTLDNTDDDGDPLNEGTGFSGNGLDVPGSEADDDMEDIGEEDEENNYYGIGGERQEPGEESKGD